jgi:hypothetical protein
VQRERESPGYPRGVFDPRGVPGYAEFKLSILGDAAEDAWAIYSPLTEKQGGDVAEAVLGDLFAEGLIYFFHHATDSLTRDADDDALRLSEAEAQAAIVDDGWREPAPTTDVHFTVTAKGQHAYLRVSKQ